MYQPDTARQAAKIRASFSAELLPTTNLESRVGYNQESTLVSLRKEKAHSSSPWLAFPENNCMQGNGVLEVHSQKTMSFGTVVNGLGNQQPISPNTAMRSSPPVGAGRGVMCLHHIDCLFTTHSAISHIHSYCIGQSDSSISSCRALLTCSQESAEQYLERISLLFCT